MVDLDDSDTEIPSTSSKEKKWKSRKNPIASYAHLKKKRLNYTTKFNAQIIHNREQGLFP